MNFLLTSILSLFGVLLLAKENYCGTFSIIHPKLFRIDTEETVVVNLYEYGNTAVAISCRLTDFPRYRSIFSSVNNVRGTADMPISFNVKVSHANLVSTQSLANKQVEMTVQVQFQNNAYPDIRKVIRVYVTGESDYIFIQTERPIYKPGDQVQIRVVPLNLQMLPLRGEDVEISVQTHDKVTVWRDIRPFPQLDFLEVTYQISQDPPLGKWYVQAKMNSTLHSSTSSTEFLIEKYVLPTYDVSVTVAQSFMKPGEEITGEFTAMYSYGEPVIGSYTFVGLINLPDSDDSIEFFARPSSIRKRSLQLKRTDNGRKTFTISTTTIPTVTKMTWDELIEEGATVSVQVSVMGLAEGIFESDEKAGILITNSPYKIDMSHTSPYFIPSLTHTLKVIVRDVVTDKPVPNVQISVTSSEIHTGTTNAEGLEEVIVETPTHNELSITIRTSQPGLRPEHQAEVVYSLVKFNSQSRKYLQVSAPGHATVGQNVYIEFKTVGSSQQNIYYLVLSRGLILFSGKKQISSRGGVASQAIMVTRKMSPSIRVVGYYMSGTEMISNSVWIDVNDVCITKDLLITPDRGTVLPGSLVDVHIQGEPGALVGLSGVDRSAYFLNSEGRLDRKKMFDQMNSFDLGCSLAGGKNGMNVFEEAGLACTQNRAATPIQDQLACPTDPPHSKRRKRSLDFGDLLGLRTPIERRCYKDGRRANLAGDSCDIRNTRVVKWEFDRMSPEERSCSQAFMRGCNQGMKIRRALDKMNRHARYSANRIDRASHSSQNTQRTRFLESWLWSSVDLNQAGSGSKEQRAPDTITTYDIDAISVHNTEGFCVANSTGIKVFKDIFIKLYLPYSVKVMEQVQIRVAVFNYHPSLNRTVDLKIKVDSNLCSQYSGAEADEWSDAITLDVASHSSKSFSFTVIPLKVPPSGDVTIELEATTVQDGSSDNIVKQLKVEESGSEEEFSDSLVLDPASSSRIPPIEFEFPDDNVVPDTRKCWIYGHMSFLGPIIEFDPINEAPISLAESIKMPYGCGEQNMMVCGPNVFAFNYLKTKRDVRASSNEEIQKYIIDGYTRQQTHRNDGVWSVYSSNSPTIWLNAYVDKVFLHAREVWPEMNIAPICDSINWIIQQQSGDGKFSEAQHARFSQIHVAAGGDVALTAYVLIALSETEINCPDSGLGGRISTARSSGASFLRRHLSDDDIIPYTAAITAYALSLVDPQHSSAREANETLVNMKTQTGDKIHWQTPSTAGNLPSWYSAKASTIDIETTAYALLSQVTLARSLGSNVKQSDVEVINSIARWLVTQKNDRGGFQSSQTTVTAIQALTEYWVWITLIDPPPRNPYLNLQLTSISGTSWASGEEFRLDGRNEFYKKEIEVPTDVIQGSPTIDVNIRSGQGRGSLSYRCIYRLTRDSEICHFDIMSTMELMGLRDAENGIDEAEPGNGKNVFKFKVIISRNTPGNTSMAIIDVALMSGFRPIESSLEDLTIDSADEIGGKVDGILDRYEISDQNVRLYVDHIPSDGTDETPLKIAFTMQQYVVVDNPNPAKIMVYDYYEPEIKCSKFYSGNGQRHLQTSPLTIDSHGVQQHKCTEGGCPTCRTRNEQLFKTCGRRYVCNHACNTDDTDSCFNMHRSVCDRNFGYLAEILEIDHEIMPGFVKLKTEIKEVYRKMTDFNVKSANIRNFIVRRDCFDNCVDDDVKHLTANGSYFVPKRTFLIMGRAPEKSVLSNNDESFSYYLDQDAFIERTITPEKCAKKEKSRAACNGDPKPKTDFCKKIRQLLKICDNQKTMKRHVSQGCD